MFKINWQQAYSLDVSIKNKKNVEVENGNKNYIFTVFFFLAKYFKKIKFLSTYIYA